MTEEILFIELFNDLYHSIIISFLNNVQYTCNTTRNHINKWNYIGFLAQIDP